MTTPYSAGTISLTNGSAVVTGIGTAWQTALIAGGTIYVQAEGNPLPILTVDSNTQITAALKWTGATGTYSYALIRDTAHDAQLVANATALARLLAGMEAGTIFKYNAEGDTAGRSFYDGRPKGFAYLDISVNPARLWIKSADAAGNWAGPFSYAQGEQGIPGPAGLVNWRGNYAAGTAYARNDAVYHNGSAFIAIQATTGNAPPVLPATSNAWWWVMAVKGSDGASFALPGRLGPQPADVGDWNLAIENGWYRSTPVSLNSPDDGVYWCGLVQNWNNAWVRQTVWSLGASAGDTITWQRDFVAGETWGAWYPVLSSQAELDARYAQIGSAGSYSPEIMVGMTLANAPVDLDHDITISPGQRRNTANTTNMDLAAAITKRIDAAWAAGNNAGGLDTGTVAANKTYFLHVIKNTTTNVVDVLFSLSPTAPAMPSGYTARRRLGAVLTDANANIHPFLQTGGWFFHLDALPGGGSVAISSAAQAVTLAKVPLGIKVIADVAFMASGGSSNVLSVCDQDLGDATINDCVGVMSASAQIYRLQIMTDAAARVNVRSQNPATMDLFYRGWFDERQG